MNRRFLVLGRERMPNQASKALALACHHLPAHGEPLHGYAPVLAESFTDIELFEGTCYKAARWEPCGMRKGFAEHRKDYYQEHGKLKKHWIKTLNRNAAPWTGRRRRTDAGAKPSAVPLSAICSSNSPQTPSPLSSVNGWPPTRENCTAPSRWTANGYVTAC